MGLAGARLCLGESHRSSASGAHLQGGPAPALCHPASPCGHTGQHQQPSVSSEQKCQLLSGHVQGRSVPPAQHHCRAGPLDTQLGCWDPAERLQGGALAEPLCSVRRLCILQGPSLPGCSNFHFHEEMKHFILYDFPTMAVIPFHLSGRRR